MLRIVARFLFILLVGSGSVSAEALKEPEGEIVLIVSGEIEHRNTENSASFDIEMLAGMPNTRYKTTTIWTDGEQIFEGVPLAEILKAVGASGAVVRATAINDYSVVIPVEEVEEDVPMVAFSMNGAPMSRRQKGPLWIVYPFDKDARYRSEMVYSRSIWQLDRLEVTN